MSESGTTNEGGTEPSGGTSGGGGSSGTGNVPTAGMDGEAGAGGMVEPPECATHNDCFAIHGDFSPHACAKGRCVALKTDECPVLLPLQDTTYELLRSSDAVVIGAYADVATAVVGMQTRNYDLALYEFANETNGITGGRANPRRQVVMVVCNGYSASRAELDISSDHLIKDLGVPAIIAGLSADDVQYIFDPKGKDADVFFLAPNYADETLINYDDGQLMWHMLSGAEPLGIPYKPLLDMTLTHLRNNASLGATEAARVALVSATDERFLQDIGTSIEKNIRFNDGKTAAENAAATPKAYLGLATTSVYKDTSFDQTPVITSLMTFKPHVIIAATADELYRTIIPEVERRWPGEAPGQARPFYLVSPFLYNSADKRNLINTTNVRTRIVGVNWSGAEDPTIYNAYLSRFNMAYADVAHISAGRENFYDAAYYLLYAMDAAGQPLIGSNINNGMIRVVTGAANRTFEVFEDTLAALNFLESNGSNKIRLVGAMGPPNWDTLTGGRQDSGSIWCINNAGNELPDVLRYNNGVLEGTFPPACFPFPAPAP